MEYDLKFENRIIKNILILTAIIVMSSCNKNLIISNDSLSSSKTFRTIDKRTIRELNFEPKYYCTTIRSKRIILSSLDKLRDDIVSWDSDVELKTSELFGMIEETIVYLNKENQKENFIQTDEREWICFELDKIAKTMKLNDLEEFQNYVDSMRDW